MKHLLIGLLLLTQWQIDQTFIETGIDLTDVIIPFTHFYETEEAIEKMHEEQIKKLESQLNLVPARIHILDKSMSEN